MDTKKLRQQILDLAIRGKLVPQDPNDEPASVLLERIKEEKERLIKEGKIKRSKRTASSDTYHYRQLECVPFEIPNSWVWTTLGDIGTWQAGGTPSRSNKTFYGGSIPWLKTGDLNDGLIINIPESITEEAVANSSAKINPVGSVLIAMYGATIGKLGILTFPATTNQACCACIEYHAVIQSYLFYFLLSQRTTFIAKGGGGAQPNISKEIIVNTTIPLPPLAEQQRIVTEIQRYFALISQIEQGKVDLQANIKQMKSRILDLAIHGKLVPQDPNDEPVSELLKRINSKAEITSDNEHYPQLPKGWKLTTLGSISNYGRCINVNVNQIRENSWVLELEDLEKGSANIIRKIYKIDRKISGVRHPFAKGEVLYSKLRTYLNKVLVAPDSGYCTTEIIPIKTKPGVLPKYVCYVMRSPYFLDYTAQCGYGVKMPRLSTTDARRAIIPLPPTKEQRRIIIKVIQLYSQLDSIAENL